jgi:hypothetical protein
MSTTIKKEIGKITNVSYGFGGYQDAMFGVSFSFGSDKTGWGCGDFKGAWGPGITVDKYTKWTEADRSRINDETTRFIADIMVKAKVRDIQSLKGVPVEVTFEGNCLKSWRILEEVI